MKASKDAQIKTQYILPSEKFSYASQIINIFVGDTSFVGPRPVWTKEYEYLNCLIDNHPLRTIVRPGITGWAQLNYKAPNFSLVIDKPTEENKKTFHRDAEKRFAYDLYR